MAADNASVKGNVQINISTDCRPIVIRYCVSECVCARFVTDVSASLDCVITCSISNVRIIIGSLLSID